MVTINSELTFGQILLPVEVYENKQFLEDRQTNVLYRSVRENLVFLRCPCCPALPLSKNDAGFTIGAFLCRCTGITDEAREAASVLFFEPIINSVKSPRAVMCLTECADAELIIQSTAPPFGQDEIGNTPNPSDHTLPCGIRLKQDIIEV
jgi:hypothetical protein